MQVQFSFWWGAICFIYKSGHPIQLVDSTRNLQTTANSIFKRVVTRYFDNSHQLKQTLQPCPPPLKPHMENIKWQPCSLYLPLASLKNTLLLPNWRIAQWLPSHCIIRVLCFRAFLVDIGMTETELDSCLWSPKPTSWLCNPEFHTCFERFSSNDGQSFFKYVNDYQWSW